METQPEQPIVDPIEARRAYQRQASKKHYDKLKAQGIPDVRRNQFRVNAGKYYETHKDQIKERRVKKLVEQGKEVNAKRGRPQKSEEPLCYSRDYHRYYYQQNKEILLAKAREKRALKKQQSQQIVE